MTETDIHAADGGNPSMDRRTMLKVLGAGGTAAAGAGGASQISPVGDAEAIACGGLCIAGAGLAAGAAVGWMLRETEVIGADDPPEGLTPDGLKSQLFQTARKRQSNNKSTFVDNQNLVKTGFRHALYGDGKLAAIDALNAEKTEANVLSDAKAAVDEYATTVKRNFLKSWNESALEVANMISTVSSHADVAPADVSPILYGSSGNYFSATNSGVADKSHTLPNGESFTIKQVKVVLDSSGETSQWGPLGGTGDGWGVFDNFSGMFHWHLPDGDVDYLSHSDWNGVWTDIETAVSEVKTGLDTWVTNIYGQVQAGELNTADLLSSRELAAMSADKEEFAQAKADLMALNIGANLDREATIRIPSSNTKLRGSLATTGETTLEPGTVDPSEDSISYYFTYDISQGSGTWSAFESGVDGGVVTLTSEPYEGVQYDVRTTANESVQVNGTEFEATGNGTWTTDLSSDLETSITEVSEINFFSKTSETQFETVQLTEPFEIVKFENADGEEVDSAEYSKEEPQNDENYISESEWQDMQDRQEELITKYENAKNDGGIGFDPSQFSAFGIPGVGVLGAGVTAAIAMVAYASSKGK